MSGTKREIIVWGEYATSRPPQRIERQPRRNGEHAAFVALGRRYGTLTKLSADLIAECRRLRRENEDLKRSAERWVDLYQRQLDRANALARAARREHDDDGRRPANGPDGRSPGHVVLAPKPDRRNPDRQSPRKGGRRLTDGE